MDPIIISKNKDMEQCFLDGIKTFTASTEQDFSNTKNILFLLDFYFPQPYPGSISPKLVKTVLNYFSSNFDCKIFIYPLFIDGIEITKAFGHLEGEFILDKEYTILFQKLRQDSNKLKYPQNFIEVSQITTENFDLIVMINQIRTDPIFTIWQSFLNLKHLINFKDLEQLKGKLKKFFNEDNENESSIFSIEDLENGQKITETIPYDNFFKLWYTQSLIGLNIGKFLVINNLHTILEGNGPYLLPSTKSHRLNQIIIGTNPINVDLATFNQLKLKKQKPFFMYFMDRRDLFDGEIFSHELLNPDKIRQYQSDRPTIREIGGPKPESIEAFPILDPNIFKEETLDIYVGKLTPSLYYSLMKLLYLLDSFSFKDLTNIYNWAIIIGEEPPDPSINEYPYSKHKNTIYIIIGDRTIHSTYNYNFKKRIKVKDVLSEHDLDLKIISKVNDLYRKITEINDNFELTLSEVINKKVDPMDRKLAALEKELKRELKIAEQRFKIKKTRINLISKNKINEIKNRFPKINPHNKIIIIDGNPPTEWDFFSIIQHYEKPYNIASLRLIFNSFKDFYHFKRFDKAIIKNQIKELKRQIKNEFKTKYLPHKKEVEKLVKEERIKRKETLDRLKREYIEECNKIKKEYQEKIDLIKSQIKTTKEIRSD